MSREPDEFLAQPELYKLSHPDLLACGRQCSIGEHDASVSLALGRENRPEQTGKVLLSAGNATIFSARAGKMRGTDYASCRSGILFIA
jgi:hypothetical protein